MNNVVCDESVARAIHARLPVASSVEFRAQYAGIAWPDTFLSVNAEDIEYEFGIAAAEEVFRGIAAGLRQIAGAEFDIFSWSTDDTLSWTSNGGSRHVRYAICPAGMYVLVDNLY